jgi:hypothetical protein
VELSTTGAKLILTRKADGSSEQLNVGEITVFRYEEILAKQEPPIVFRLLLLLIDFQR